METIEISPRVRAFLGAPLPSLAKATVLELLAARRYVTVLLMCTEPCDEKLQALYHLQRYRELEEESENMSTAQARLYHAIAPFLNGNQLESMSRLEKLVQCPEFATSTKLEEACSWLSKVSVALGVPERMESGSAAVMGRHYLALGDVDRADTLLTDSRDKAMVLVARKDYQKAIGLFRDVNVRELDAQSQVGVANNLAVCLLYCQEVDDAVKNWRHDVDHIAPFRRKKKRYPQDVLISFGESCQGTSISQLAAMRGEEFAPIIRVSTRRRRSKRHPAGVDSRLPFRGPRDAKHVKTNSVLNTRTTRASDQRSTTFRRSPHTRHSRARTLTTGNKNEETERKTTPD
eukprot:GEMP01046032.1.p1 GENE.GEMP01046032.1~~GEMP01046032.1.p1  ORF type:complete len:347 (+),score=59.18 GEMP01046032.1:94-1134(+)